MLDDINELEQIARDMEAEEKLKYEYLLGRQVQSYIMYDFGPMMMEDAMFPEAMQDGGNGGDNADRARMAPIMN